MDPKLHKDPDAFEPSRYLNKPLSAADYINANNPYDRDHFAYGAGRRVCPGVHVAERSLYINIVRTLWGFNITKPVGKDGKPIDPDTSMVRGFLSVPVPFRCEITPRTARHAEVIRADFAEATKAQVVQD